MFSTIGIHGVFTKVAECDFGFGGPICRVAEVVAAPEGAVDLAGFVALMKRWLDTNLMAAGAKARSAMGANTATLKALRHLKAHSFHRNAVIESESRGWSCGCRCRAEELCGRVKA